MLRLPAKGVGNVVVSGASPSYDRPVSTREPGPGRSSDVLDAILDKVADNRTRTETTSTLFRAKALDQLDIATDIDNQLPLVSRRNWLLLLGAGLIVLAFVVWAALTPATQTVSGTGRVLAPSGLLAVTSPKSGYVEQMLVASGDQIVPGFTVALIQDTTSETRVNSIVGGTTWQVAKALGAPVGAGEVIVTVLPADSEGTALVVLPSASADQVRPGMRVSANGDDVGAVVSVEPPLPTVNIMLRTGIMVGAEELASIVVVDLAQPGTPGSEAVYTIQLTNETVLQQMLNR